MKIFQILPSMAFGDAVGNDTLALQKVIKEMGFETEIYAENVDPRLAKGKAHSLHEEKPVLTEQDILIYHMSTGSDLNYWVGNVCCRKIMIYHNITPPVFFHDYNQQAEINAQYGLDGLKYLSDKVEYCLADSEFNREELRKAGFSCKIDIRPILIPFSDYAQKPAPQILKAYDDDAVNLLFVGRIAPNKKQEDIISAFACYQREINDHSRLFLVGSWQGMERYHERLVQYGEKLHVHDLIFTGHIRFPEILGYYHVSDIFICMSEHEGFCVPLTEAMYFDLPVIAYQSSAVSGTLGGGGFLLQEKNPVETAYLIDRILSDTDLKEQILCNQRERLKDFSYDRIRNIFSSQLKAFLEGGK